MRDRSRLGDLRGGGAADGEGGKPHERELTKVQRGLFIIGGGSGLYRSGNESLFANGAAVHPDPAARRLYEILTIERSGCRLGLRLLRPVIQ